jgi:hypothetical protein
MIHLTILEEARYVQRGRISVSWDAVWLKVL